MAFPVEDLAAGVAEGVAGPWGVVLVLGALALLASRGSAELARAAAADGPDGRTLGAATGRLGRLRDGWRTLAAEARAERAARRPRQRDVTVAFPESEDAAARGRDGGARVVSRSSNGAGAH